MNQSVFMFLSVLVLVIVIRNRARNRKPCEHGALLKTALIALALALPLLAPARADAQLSILTSKHNLSASGSGAVHAVSEQRVCIFCHTPHGGRTNAPLWNRRDSGAAYTPYNSPTLKAQPGQPTGASKLCLSCHDGTIAMGDLVSEDQAVAMNGSQTMPAGHGLIGTDLGDDHPISFNYFDSLAQLGGKLNAPAGWDPRVKLDANSEVQCTTCHDPHDDQWGKFLVMDNQEAALCRVCHKLDDYTLTEHSQSTSQWNGTGPNPWPNTPYTDVKSNGCMNCHTSHHAGGKAELLTSAREEDVCFVCHDGSVAKANLQAVFNMTYHHPVEQTQGVHQDGENALMQGDHVECVDCHNPHRAKQLDAEAPNVKGVLAGVTGVDANGTPVSEAAYEYQICFKCHATDSGSAPLGAITRQVSTFNTLRQFSPASPSFHPVEVPGKNADVPSLLSPLTPASMIYCSDCHGNDQAQPGTRGPHGSSQEFMLTAQYRTGDNITENATAYALCYRCHNRASILANESFPQHSLHIVDQHTPCSVCHDAHGIDYGKGSPTNNAHLVNFDMSVVEKNSSTGELEYRSLGPRTDECYLRCHGVDHGAATYGH